MACAYSEPPEMDQEYMARFDLTASGTTQEPPGPPVNHPVAPVEQDDFDFLGTQAYIHAQEQLANHP